MRKFTDNLRNFATNIEIDKTYLQSVFSDALEEAKPRINKIFTFGEHETWRVDRHQNGGIPCNNNNDRNNVDVNIVLKSKNSDYTSLSSFMLKFYEKKFKSQNLYGLNKELDECPNFELSRELFKEKYSYSKKTVLSNNYAIFSAEDKDFKLARKYKHLNMYLDLILNSYSEIFDNHGVNYVTREKIDNQKINNVDALKKQIVILDSNGHDFMSLHLKLTQELRVINNRFMYDYKIRICFSRFGEDTSPFLSIGGSVKKISQLSIPFTNNFQLLFLDSIENPNYYLFMATPRGLVKMNKVILNDSIYSMFIHYVVRPILQEANLEFESEGLNLGDYLLMYEMVKY